MSDEIVEATMNDAQRMFQSMHQVSDELDAATAKVKTAVLSAVGTMEDVYQTLADAKANLARKLASLDTLPPVEVPYGVDQLVSLALRMEDMNDKTWERFCALAAAMREEKR